MQLSNFSPITDVSASSYGIALDAFKVKWDLHNYAGFLGFDYSIMGTLGPILTLKWHIPGRVIEWLDTNGVPNAQGIPLYPSTRFSLVFTKVDYLEVAPRDPDMPGDEDAMLDAAGCIEASEDSSGYRDKGWVPSHDPSQDNMPFHMVFRFRGGQFMRIGAEKAEFVLLDE